jgi:hypothetical protein
MINVRVYRKQYGPFQCGDLISAPIAELYSRISSLYLVTSRVSPVVKQTNSGASVRQRTIPTERPPLVGEVSANFSG